MENKANILFWLRLCLAVSKKTKQQRAQNVNYFIPVLIEVLDIEHRTVKILESRGFKSLGTVLCSLQIVYFGLKVLVIVGFNQVYEEAESMDIPFVKLNHYGLLLFIQRFRTRYYISYSLLYFSRLLYFFYDNLRRRFLFTDFPFYFLLLVDL